MKTLKEKSEALISYLANKELSFGCVLECEMWSQCEGEDKEYWTERYVIKKHKNEDGEVYGSEIKGADGENMQGYISMNEEGLIIIGHPVLIGDVLEKLFDSNDLEFGFDKTENSLIEKWGNTVSGGYDKVFTKSLNELFDGEIVRFDDRTTIDRSPEFKDQNIQDLHAFLWDIFAESIEK